MDTGLINILATEMYVREALWFFPLVVLILVTAAILAFNIRKKRNENGRCGQTATLHKKTKEYGTDTVNEVSVTTKEDCAVGGAVAEQAVANVKAETVVKTEKSSPKTEEVSEKTTEKAKDELTLGGKIVRVRYDRSFTAKLIQAEKKVQHYYSEIKNSLSSYEKAKSRVLWGGENFSVGRNVFAKLFIRGKTVFVNLPLEPNGHFYDDYKAEYVGNVKKYEKTPMRIRVKTERGLKNAVNLIGIVAESNGFVRTETDKTDYFFAYETTEALIEKKLIKLIPVGKKGVPAKEENSETNLTAAVADESYETRNVISAADAPTVMSSESARKMIKTFSGGKWKKSRKVVVNVDVLSASFSAGDMVTVDKLIEKKIVPSKTKAVKILARGVLDKPLTVIAQDYSDDAVKMILIVGGEVWKEI